MCSFSSINRLAGYMCKQAAINDELSQQHVNVANAHCAKKTLNRSLQVRVSCKSYIINVIWKFHIDFCMKLFVLHMSEDSALWAL